MIDVRDDTMQTTFVETFAYTFAHYLPSFPEDHPCREMHGHTAIVTVTITAYHDDSYAFDRAVLGHLGKWAVGPLDHRTINDEPGLESGLAEDQLAWLVGRFTKGLADHGLNARLTQVELVEFTSENGRLAMPKLLWRAAE